MNITQALDRFLVQLEANGRSIHSLCQSRRHVRLLATWLEAEGRSVEITEINHEVLAKFLASPAARTRPDGKTKRATSVNCLRASLRTFFAYLTQAGYLPTNPASVIKRALCASPPPRAMAPEDQRKLLATLAAAEGFEAERDHLLFHLMLATGTRLGSALGLQASDIDLDCAEITLRSTKGDRPETLPIGQAIRDHLARNLAKHLNGTLFARRNGRPLTPRHVERRFRQWLRKAGITRPATPHSLRHSFAQDLYRKTGDILLVKAALRHRSITSTLVYARADGERLREVLG